MEREGPSESTGSEALQVFQTHLDKVMYLLHGISRDTQQLLGPIGAANLVTAQTADALRSLQKGSPTLTLELAHVSSNFAALKKYIDEIGAVLQANVQVHPFLFDWILVMVVAFSEAYLENVLLLLISASPALIKTKETVKLSGAEVLEIEEKFDTTEKRWQELMVLLRKRWVKQFLNESPGRWIARLEKFGASKYPPGLPAQMTTIWNRRHAIVHAPRTAQSDLSAESVAALAQIRSEFSDAIGVIGGFVKVTDAFVVGVLKAQHLP